MANTARRPTVRRSVGALSGSVLAATWAALALAHAPPEASALLEDEGGRIAVIVTNRGLIFRDAEADTYRLMCSEALGVGNYPVPQVTILGDGRLLAATLNGLQVTQDGGCTWQGVAPLAESATPALAPHPAERDTVYVMGTGAMSGVHATRDGGLSWELLIALQEADWATSLLVSPTDPDWIYASGYDPVAMPRAFFLLRSQNGGADWERVPLPQDATYADIQIQAVDPRDPERILLSTITWSPQVDASQLLLSEQGGAEPEVVLETPSIAGAAFDGQGRVWVAAQEGLLRSDGPLSDFERVTDAAYLSCVEQRSDALVACGYYAGELAGSGVGRWTPGGQDSAGFATFMDFSQVDAPVECASTTDTYSACEGPWRDWAREILGEVPGAGGATGGVSSTGGSPATGGMATGTAGGDAGGDPAPLAGAGTSAGTPAPGSADRGSSGCSCSVLPSPTPRGPATAAAMGLLCGVLARGRRMRRRRQQRASQR